MRDYRLDLKNSRQLTPAEARRLDALPIDYSDIPPLGAEFFAKATEAWPLAKQQLTVSLDADVVAWFKAYGKGYQTRINRILRAAMESEPSRRSGSMATPKKNTRSPDIGKPAYDQLFVERRAEGDYAVRKANADRASAVLPTQAEAIQKARELNPDKAPLIERVRNNTGGKPDKWRKP